MEKIRTKGLLAAILALLCAIAFSLAAVPLITKTAYADIQDEKDTLAAIAGYTDFDEMSSDLKNGNTLNVSDFGSTLVDFGGMSWWPVYAYADNGKVVLTLWLEMPVGSYTFTDGTTSASYTITPLSNDYQYSWIRAAINAGQTEEGYYYGSFNGDNQPKQYQNNEAPNASHVAPTDFTAFADFVANGKEAQYIIPGSEYGDNVWLPSVEEAQIDGTWALTTTQYSTTQISSNYAWLRTPFRLPHEGYVVSMSGGLYDAEFGYAYAVRPAININLSTVDEITVTPGKPVANNAKFSYSGGAQTYLPKGFDADSMNITGNVQTDVGSYTVTVTRKSGTWADGTTGALTFNFTINKAVPKVVEGSKDDSYDVDSGMPDLSSILSATNADSGDAVAGVYTYVGNPSPIEGTDTYSWLFTPDDTDNYETTTGTIILTFEDSNGGSTGTGGTGSGSTGTGGTGSGSTGTGGTGTGGTGTGGTGTGGTGTGGTGSGSTGTGGTGTGGTGTGGTGTGGTGSGSTGSGGTGSGSTGSGGATDSTDPADGQDNDSTSGAGSFFNSVKNFFAKNWWWLLIALAALTLLIIIIVVASRRKKNDDEKKAKKEEKAKREEEQIRAIEQQAPVAAASMVAAQPVIQPIVQPVQQPVQPVVVQQPNFDLSILAEMRADIAEIKAKQSMPQVNYVPNYPAPATASAPQPTAAPAYAFAPAIDNGTLARLEAQMNAMQAEQRARYEAEQHAEMAALKARYEAEDHAEVAALRAEQRVDRESRQSAELAAMREQLNGKSAAGNTVYTAPSNNGNSIPAEVVVALLQAVNKGGAPVILNAAPAPAQTKPAVPPDAVVTTTTTVDRTKNNSTNFDVDGFYDKYE